MPEIAGVPAVHLNGRGDFDQVFETVRQFQRRAKEKRTLIGTVNDICALAALKVWEEAGASDKCAVVSQNAIREARDELRRPDTRLIGSVAYFPERYGNHVIPLAISILRKKAVAPAMFVRHQLLTPCNVDLLYPLDAGAKHIARR